MTLPSVCVQWSVRLPVACCMDLQVLRGRGVVHSGLNLDELSSSEEEREMAEGRRSTSPTSRECTQKGGGGSIEPPSVSFHHPDGAPHVQAGVVSGMSPAHLGNCASVYV